jgi:hypothetical protein
MTRDDELGMTWWNHLDEAARRYWMARAGNTGRAKDAWEAFKTSQRGTEGPLPSPGTPTGAGLGGGLQSAGAS